jgi:hypothetical protein
MNSGHEQISIRYSKRRESEEKRFRNMTIGPEKDFISYVP